MSGLRTLVALSFFSVANIAFGASPQSPVLDQIRSEFKDKKKFEVRFTQRVDQELFPNEDSSASGFLTVTRPNQLKWVYEKPEPRVIEFDGKNLVIDGEKMEAAGALTLEESFSFLWGEVSSQFFELETIDKNQLKLKVKDSVETSFQSILIRLQKGRIKEVIVSDRTGGKSHLSFEKWKF